MVKKIPATNHPLDRGLICAALNANLRSILVFDASSEALESAAQRLKLMLERVTQHHIKIVYLGAIETEEDLWGSIAFCNSDSGSEFEWKPGLLAGGRGQELRLVVIPDLNRLSLAATRACVTAIGAEVVYLERHGQTDAWKPNLCWLAACNSDPQQVGMLSPHLLDRFALRLSERASVSNDRIAILEQLLEELEASTNRSTAALSPEVEDLLDRGKSRLPRVLQNARQRVLEYLAPNGRYSIRRDLALLRLAQINALWAESSAVNLTHVDEAARTIGLKLHTIEQVEKKMPLTVEEEILLEEEMPVSSQNSTTNETSTEQAPEILRQPDTKTDFPFQTITRSRIDPYPEDLSPIQREASSLRLPLRRLKNMQQGRGEIVGVEPTTLLEDLAIISTFLEVWKYQQPRREALQQQGKSRDGLIILPTDLRRYRRAIVPVQMLAMTINFTCLENCQWEQKLLPYLQWAYIERASACLIQIGAVENEELLRANKIAVSNILVPRLTRGLEAKRGKATPLAHGLHLTLQTLRHALQHGRSTVERVVLVVISDGRGNVPLAASHSGEIIAPVGRQGIEDALEVARQISALQRVQTVFLNPQPGNYSDLPIELATALGANTIEAMLPLGVPEVGGQ
jgi:magnesium chelatase subunit D